MFISIDSQSLIESFSLGGGDRGLSGRDEAVDAGGVDSMSETEESVSGSGLDGVGVGVLGITGDGGDSVLTSLSDSDFDCLSATSSCLSVSLSEFSSSDETSLLRYSRSPGL